MVHKDTCYVKSIPCVPVIRQCGGATERGCARELVVPRRKNGPAAPPEHFQEDGWRVVRWRWDYRPRPMRRCLSLLFRISADVTQIAISTGIRQTRPTKTVTAAIVQKITAQISPPTSSRMPGTVYPAFSQPIP